MNRSTYVLNGNITSKVDLGDDNNLLVSAYNFQGNGYKKIAERTFEGYCKVTYDEKMRSMYENIERSSNVKKFGTCPHPAVRIIKFYNIFNVIQDSNFRVNIGLKT